jgi:hypothetical protein
MKNMGEGKSSSHEGTKNDGNDPTYCKEYGKTSSHKRMKNVWNVSS